MLSSWLLLLCVAGDGEEDFAEELLAWGRNSRCQESSRCAHRELLLEEREGQLPLILERVLSTERESCNGLAVLPEY